MLSEVEHITNGSRFQARVKDIGFNAAILPVNWGGIDSPMRPVIVSRKPTKVVPERGEPDYNRLEVSFVTGEPTGLKVTDQVTIWEPGKVPESSGQPSVCNYEDFRASSDGLCGLSVIEKTPGRLISLNITEPDKYIPYPGVVRLPVRLPNSVAFLEQAFGELPEVTILKSLGPGKNFTPIGRINNKKTFLFRPEGEENNHKLQVVAYNEKTQEAKVVNILVFPKSSWSKWRMGTAAGLFWLDKKHAILPIHGINKENSATNAEGLYNYSLGVALIKRDEYGRLQVLKVADKPLIVPDQLDNLIGERFPGHRRIVYSCGVWLEGSVFNFLVNKGDIGTILVKIPLREVVSSLTSYSKNPLPNAA